MKTVLLFLGLAAAAFGQCGRFVFNPLTQQLDCIGSTAGLGTVTSVGLLGTANQITVSGSSPITTSGSWTLSLANPAHSYVCNIGSATSTTVITTGDTGCYSDVGSITGTITAVYVTGNAAALATCSITVDIWKANAAYPTSSDKISASAPAALSSAKTNDAGSVGTWTTAVAAHDRFGSSVASVTGCVYAQVRVEFR